MDIKITQRMSNWEKTGKCVVSFMAMACLGSPYGWAVVGSALTRQQGYFQPSSQDMTLSESTLAMTIALGVHGVSASLLGSVQYWLGVRNSVFLGGSLFALGMLVASYAVHCVSLTGLLLSYGVVSGTGIGLAYTPIIQRLTEWLPNRKGLAAAVPIAGFGSGGMLFAAASQWLMNILQRPPLVLGPRAEYAVTPMQGGLFVRLHDQWVEVVQPTPETHTLYRVGTGDTGVVGTLLLMGLLYGLVLLSASFLLGPPSLQPTGHTQSQPASVKTSTVMVTHQFWCLFIVFLSIASAGIGVLSISKTMFQELFGEAVGVSAEETTQFVVLLTAGNLLGRLVWGVASDYLGRPLCFTLFTFCSLLLTLALPTLVDIINDTSSSSYLLLFQACSFGLLFIMGGVFSVCPAYESDLFGVKYLAANHGRMLLAQTGAALMGPYVLLHSHRHSTYLAVLSLAPLLSDSLFHQHFGHNKDAIPQLLADKTLSIKKLMAILPPGVPDPSFSLYNRGLYLLGGLVGIGLVAGCFISPVSRRHFEDYRPDEEETPLNK